jgi:iron(III) transport system substrate-binding protein
MPSQIFYGEGNLMCFNLGKREMQIIIMVFVFVALMLDLAGCAREGDGENVVVVYTAVDQPFAEPILRAFEQETGIKVQAVYDVEATKTTGLVNRLIAEKDLPRADVFWNNEIIQTMVLKENGVLAPYVSPQFDEIPRALRDPEGYWAAYAARARVFIVNLDRVPQPETIDSLDDFFDPAWRGSDIGVAYPLFGTTATHAAALYEALGTQEASEFFHQLVEREVRVVDGNSVVRDLVASGQMAFGLTDTDDACGALLRGDPVAVNLPDQDDLGTLVIPATVAMIDGAPHPEQGKALIDHLLSKEVEQSLVDAGFSHIPMHRDIQIPRECLDTTHIRAMEVDFMEVQRKLESVQNELREIFLR